MKRTFSKKDGILYKQLYEYLAAEIRDGRLKNGEQLPSRRDMARQAGVSEITVDYAYKLLSDTGYAVIKARQGIFVRFAQRHDYAENPWENATDQTYVFSPDAVRGQHDTKLFRSMKNLMQSEQESLLDYPEKNGETALRIALQGLLYRERDIKTPASNLIVGGGAEYLLVSLAQTLGRDMVYLLPDYPPARSCAALRRAGARLQFLPICENGLNIDALRRTDGNILYLTPYCQYPLSLRMSQEQRQAALDWAYQKPDRYIIEDAYDFPFCAGSDKTSLFDMDTKGRVIYLDSFFRTISPAFRLAYIILPDPLLLRWKQAHPYFYPLASKLDQALLQEYLNSGAYSRYVQETAKLYARRKRLLIQTLKKSVIGTRLTIYESNGGTHILVKYHGPGAEGQLKRAALSAGVKIFTMSRLTAAPDPGRPEQKIFMLGYGGMEERELMAGAEKMAEAFDRLQAD